MEAVRHATATRKVRSTYTVVDYGVAGFVRFWVDFEGECGGKLLIALSSQIPVASGNIRERGLFCEAIPCEDGKRIKVSCA